jgi:hypothetical protein
VLTVNRIHVLAASLVIGLSAIFGVAAATKTVGIGSPEPAASTLSHASIAARQRRLYLAEASLRKSRAQNPPALPALPAARPAPAAPRIQLVAQPAPAAASSHSSFDDDHEEHEDEGDDD